MAPPKFNLGGPIPTRIGRYSNDYTRALNNNLIKMAMGFRTGVKSKTTTLPDTAVDGDMYIDPANGFISMWLDTFDDNVPSPAPNPSGFYQIVPTFGMTAIVQDEEKMYVFGESGTWELLFDMAAPHVGVEREIALYAPGLLRPNNAIVYQYVAGMEFTIEAGAPNSGAHLDVAPSSNISIAITASTGSVGTLTFASGSQAGVFNIPSEVIVQPAAFENMYVQAHVLTFTGPASWAGAEGLSFTLRGKIRAID